MLVDPLPDHPGCFRVTQGEKERYVNLVASHAENLCDCGQGSWNKYDKAIPCPHVAAVYEYLQETAKAKATD